MSKTIPILAITVAFVAGTLISSVVYADEKNGKPFEAIWDAIHALESTPTNGIANVYLVHTSQEIRSEGGIFTIDVRATCNSGHIVLGGGVGFEEGITILADKPDGDNGWLGTFQTGSSLLKEVTVDAICATP